MLPKTYAYSRVFQNLLDYGLKSKVAKTRQIALDELEKILKRSGISACEPSKACPAIASMIADKDPNVRKSALSVLRYFLYAVVSISSLTFFSSEVYTVEGEKIWAMVGNLNPKDKTQLDERLRRVAGPSTPSKAINVSSIPAAQASRLSSGIGRPASPSGLPTRNIHRPASPGMPAISRLARPTSPSRSNPLELSGIAKPPGTSNLPGPTSPPTHGKSTIPSRLGPPKSRLSNIRTQIARPPPQSEPVTAEDEYTAPSSGHVETWRNGEYPEEPDLRLSAPNSDITLTISSVLSSDSDRSVDALKKVQKILQLGPDAGPSTPAYRDLAEHTEGLIETITLQMAHAFDRPERHIRLAKHLIQTLNTFCDNPLLAESLTVDILTALLEELATRLLQTDDSPDKEVKNLSRFINMIMLRLFSTGRRITIFRCVPIAIKCWI